MTCIIVERTDNLICAMSDDRITGCDSSYFDGQDKLMSDNKSFVLGISGALCTITALQYTSDLLTRKWPKKGPHVKDILNILQVFEPDMYEGCELIFASWQDDFIYLIDESLSVLVLPRTFGATGSGASHALGYYEADSDSLIKDHMCEAIDVAGSYMADVGQPYKFYSIQRPL